MTVSICTPKLWCEITISLWCKAVNRLSSSSRGNLCAPCVRDERRAADVAGSALMRSAPVVRLVVQGHERLSPVADAASQDQLVQVQAAVTGVAMQTCVRH